MRNLIEVLKFIFTRKKYWIAPVLIILLVEIIVELVAKLIIG